MSTPFESLGIWLNELRYFALDLQQEGAPSKRAWAIYDGLNAAHDEMIIRHREDMPTEEAWKRAIDESWAWFEENLGCTPCSLDVQHWIDGYIPRHID